ncbi:MAG: 16S rRNA (adenine(1518)-N(6)/adenine(1519)-N(6))-dimethyltransferase RsmA [Patescibacteria group bacterium]|jgi:16S rRNA (adenine1518-N6/adenine1519-N6)-dimethyltransferase
MNASTKAAKNEQHGTTELLRQYGVMPKKKFGQNFLVDDEVYDSIMTAAAVQSSDTILEIGPGVGSLTERLVAKANRVVAVEIDRELVTVLRERFAAVSKLEVCEGDILAKPLKAFNVAAPYRVVANIPYNITAALIRKFLSDDVQPLSMTLLVQREVAERIVAAPGKMSLLGLSAQLYATPVFVRSVPRESFYPPPSVMSAVVHFSLVHSYPFSDVPEAFFWRVAKMGFAGRRKQLQTNIRAGFQLSREACDAIFKKSNIAERARAQELTVLQWHTLSLALQKL